MTVEQKKILLENLIGRAADLNSLGADRIRAKIQYYKVREQLEKLLVRVDGSLQYVGKDGISIKWLTPSGKSALWIPNDGMENRSRYCGSLWIEGENIFTSGTITRAILRMVAE